MAQILIMEVIPVSPPNSFILQQSFPAKSISQCPVNSILTNTHSYSESEPMDPVRRPSFHHRRIMHGPAHDSWPGLPVLGSRTKKVGALHDLGLYGLLLRHSLPM